jgi:hypothetical protein
VTSRAGRDAWIRVSAHPVVSRRQWSQRSLSSSGDRTTQSSCPSKRHRIENSILTPRHAVSVPSALTDSKSKVWASSQGTRATARCWRANSFGSGAEEPLRVDQAIGIRTHSELRRHELYIRPFRWMLLLRALDILHGDVS